MGYYDGVENVEAYIRMAADYDGSLLVDILRRRLPCKSSVLELGMGPGKDLLLHDQHFQVVGTDVSAIFAERSRKLHPQLAVQQLDAIAIEMDRRFDANYSNKVLSHLAPEELRASFKRQAQVLENSGLALHSFWIGDAESEHQGLRFVYYREDPLKRLYALYFETPESGRYAAAD